MAQTNINIRMDDGLKKDFEWLCTELGLNMTTAVNVFARAAVRSRRIPFDIALDIPNAETLEAMEEVRRMKEDPSLGKGYTDIDKMMKELLA